MTDTPETPDETPEENGGVAQRVEPVGLEVEMQRSYLDYAMSVIVGRALPDVRDGLKPVHRKILYAMYDSGFRPDRGYVKCARVVGDVMGNYHPHGDSSIYDALVRMGQPWSLRYPLIDGNGNFGSPGNDPPAAMRYCVTGATLVRTPLGTVRLDQVVPDAVPDSETDIDLKVYDRNGDVVRATKFFHSGEHPTLKLRTREGFELTGTHNHPVLCLVSVAGVPTLLWKLLSEIGEGDRVVMQRIIADEIGTPTLDLVEAAVVAGGFVSEGWASENRAGFNNVDGAYFARVLSAYDIAVGGQRYLSRRTIASGTVLHELDVQNVEALKTSVLAELIGFRSAHKFVPSFVWQSPAAVKRAFLQSLFEGDGSSSLLPRNTIQISYSTRSGRLAAEVQQLLLEFGVVAKQCLYENGEIKVVVTNRRNARLFAVNVGFLGRKQAKLESELGAIPATSTAMSGDHVPFVGDFIRTHGANRWMERNWLVKHNVDRIERWERDRDAISAHITEPGVLDVVEPLVDGRFYYAEVTSVTDAGVQAVYSLRVDTDDHAFITNGFVSHNTESKLAPLAMEMLRDIDEDTVDMQDNYDGRTKEPTILPARFPNLLVNG